MNKETGDFVEAVKDHRVSPHDDRYRVVAVCKTICADEKSFRVREYPDTEKAEKIDRVTQISYEVVIADFLV